MAKQTLFEAEAILTANTAGMLRDIDDAVTKAQARLNSLNGSVNIFGSGGGGGRGGGSSQNPNNNNNSLYRLNMELAKQQTIQGNLARAAQMYGNIMTSTLFTSEQITRAETARLRVLNQIANSQKQLQGPLLPNGNFYAGPGGITRQSRFAKTGLPSANPVTDAVLAGLMSGPTIPGGGGAGGGSGKGGGLQTAMFANASYAIQDLVTVLSMGGGLQRALLSASNNIGFMASMTGTATGALVGVGAVVGSVVVPALYKAAMGFEDLSKGAERAAKRVEDLKRAMERTKSFADAYREATSEENNPLASGGLYSNINETGKDIATANRVLQTAKEEASTARGGAVRDFFSALGLTGKSMSQDPQWQQWQQGITSGKITSSDVREFARNTNFLEDAMFGTGPALEALAKAIDDANDPSKDAAANVEELNIKLRALQEIAKTIGEYRFDMPGLMRSMSNNAFGMAEGFGPNAAGGPGMWLGGQTFGQAAGPPPGFTGGRFNPSSNVDWLEARKGALDSFISEYAPKEAEKLQIQNKFDNLIGLTDNPTTVAQLKTIRDAHLAKVDARTSGGISGQMGAPQFANQLTNQLLSHDPQEELVKLTKDQAGLLTNLLGDRGAIATSIKELNTSPFTE